MRRLGAVLAVLVMLFGACGDSGSDAGDAATTTTESTGAPTTSTTVASTTTTAPEPAGDDLPDGRSPVYITKLDVAGRKVTFDLLQFLTGDAAAKAAAQDGKESPPPNDYYIRNQSQRLRTRTISAGATITVNSLKGGDNADKEITLAELSTYFGAGGEGPGAVFWLTIGGGEVTAIEQQYLP